MAGSQYQGVTGEGVDFTVVGDFYGGNGSVLDVQPGELMAKAHFGTQRDQLLSHGLHHQAENVGADVGLVGPLDVLRGPVLHKGAEHMGDAGVIDASGELAVGEGAGASLAKLHVGAGVQLPGGPVGFHRLGALVHVAATLQYHGLQAGPGQGQSGEQSGGASTHHHRGEGGGAAQGWQGVGRLLPQGYPLGVTL